jgi:hypothetical protein
MGFDFTGIGLGAYQSTKQSLDAQNAENDFKNRKMQFDLQNMQFEQKEKAKQDYLAQVSNQLEGLKQIAASAVTPQQKLVVKKFADGLKETYGGLRAQQYGVDNYVTQMVDMASAGPNYLDNAKLKAQGDALDPSLQETIRHNKASEGIDSKKVEASSSSSIFGTPSTSLTGDDFLKSLPSQEQNIVKAISEGRMQLPSGLRSKYNQQLAAAVAQYDPTFDQTDYNKRSKTVQAFTSGAESKNLNAISTIAGHLADVKHAFDDLHNYGGLGTMLNGPKNAMSDKAGQAALKTFEATVNAAAPELAKAYAGSTLSESEIKERRKILSSSSSPAQMNQVLTEVATLLKSKADALQNQYNQGMGAKASQLDFVSPKAKKAFKDLGVDFGSDGTSVLDEARDAIAKGAPRDAVIKRLTDMGVDPAGL